MTFPRILCLGEILFDCLANQVGRSLAEVESWTAYPGGAPANVACGLVKLGIPTAFIGCVGDDEPGQKLLSLLKEIGVNTDGIQIKAAKPTRQVYVLRSHEGDREFAGFGNLPPEGFADAFLQADLLPEDLFQRADYLIIGTLELAYPQTREAIFKALELADRHHVKVVMDVNWRPMFWPNLDEAKPLIKTLWPSLDFLKLSDDEAQLFFDTEDAGAIAHRLNSVEGVLVTAGGAKPVSYCLSQNEGKVAPVAVKVEDTTGAGDAFVAGFVAQLHKLGISSLNNPDTAKTVVQYACAVGGLTTMKPGAIAAQPTLAEVEAFLQ